MASKLPQLWKCPKCGERFVTRNIWRSCGKFTLEALFAHSEPHVFQLFNKFAEMMRKCEPVTMIPLKAKSRSRRGPTATQPREAPGA